MPGARDHAIFRSWELEADPSGLFVGIRAAVAKRLEQHAAPTSTKPD